MTNEQMEVIKYNFKTRNVDVEFFHLLDDAKKRIVNLILQDQTVGVGNSQTLKKMMITQALKERGNTVYDKTLAVGKEETILIKRKALLTDWYLSGTNALSVEGHIVNIDHSGNRVAALSYGPERVIIVVSKNKVVDTLEQAINRAKNHAARLIAIRAGYNPHV